MRNSAIQWTQDTWNPIRGCTRVSPGCVNCYAESMAARFSGEGLPYHGFAHSTPAGPRWTGKVAVLPDVLDRPLRWTKPRLVFVNSMSDLFHERLSREQVMQVLAFATAAGWRRGHRFQVLTKRAERMRATLTDEFWREVVREASALLVEYGDHPDSAFAMREAYSPMPTCFWLGVSVENEETATARVPDLLRTNAPMRWVSYEPALGPVAFRGTWHNWLAGWDTEPEHTAFCSPEEGCVAGCPQPVQVQTPALDWIVVGGESGKHARPFDLEWARSTLRDCHEERVPVFVKQFGSRPVNCQGSDDHDHSNNPFTCHPVRLRHPKGGDMHEWPLDLQVREWPTAHLPGGAP